MKQNEYVDLSMMRVSRSPIEHPIEHQAFSIDDELYIHQAFATNASQGCTLLFKKYFNPLCNHVVRFVYSKSIAEDIVSEIFCKFWEKETYRTIKCFRYYLFCAARNNALTHVRLHFKNERDAEKENLIDDQSKTPESLTSFDELQHWLKGLIQSLPPKRRAVFILSRFEEKSHAEIANEMNLSVKTVESYITVALASIRAGLRDYDCTPQIH